MPANNYLPDVLETTEAEHLATGFIFYRGSALAPNGGQGTVAGLGCVRQSGRAGPFGLQGQRPT